MSSVAKDSAISKSQAAATSGVTRLQDLVRDRIGKKGFHGHLVLTVTFFDGAITGSDIETKERFKTE